MKHGVGRYRSPSWSTAGASGAARQDPAFLREATSIWCRLFDGLGDVPLWMERSIDEEVLGFAAEQMKSATDFVMEHTSKSTSKDMRVVFVVLRKYLFWKPGGPHGAFRWIIAPWGWHGQCFRLCLTWVRRDTLWGLDHCRAGFGAVSTTVGWARPALGGVDPNLVWRSSTTSFDQILAGFRANPDRTRLACGWLRRTLGRITEPEGPPLHSTTPRRHDVSQSVRQGPLSHEIRAAPVGRHSGAWIGARAALERRRPAERHPSVT